MPDDKIYRELFERAPQAMFVCMRDRTIVSANRYAQRLLSRENHHGDETMDMFAGVCDAIAWADGTAEWTGFVTDFIGRSDQRFDAKIRRLRNTKDKVFYAVALVEKSRARAAFQDFGREVGLAEKLQSQRYAERIKDQFVSIVSHELRTPMTSIIGALGLAKSGKFGPLPQPVEDLLGIGLSNGDRLLQLINDILDFEKLQAGKFNFNYEDASLRDMLVKAVSDVEGMAVEKGLSVAPPGGDNDAVVNVDILRFAQVMANLLSNAIKFSPPGGVVRTCLTIGGETARIAVSDEGPGIDPKFQPQLFEKFTQADGAENRRHGGTGLGLSITKEIVREFGGVIGVNSRVGEGSEFFVDLPFAAVEGKPQGDQASFDSVKAV